MWIALALLVTLAAEQPETVMITLRAKAGAEQALADVLARHYDTARRLDLVKPDAPHVTLRSAEDQDTPYFVEIFTWRAADIPDHAPAAILEIWKQMNALVESRGGKAGMDIVEMIPVTPAK
jgi:hypothetical protein